jgi:hypothetical protein
MRPTQKSTLDTNPAIQSMSHVRSSIRARYLSLGKRLCGPNFFNQSLDCPNIPRKNSKLFFCFTVQLSNPCPKEDKPGLFVFPLPRPVILDGRARFCGSWKVSRRCTSAGREERCDIAIEFHMGARPESGALCCIKLGRIHAPSVDT